MVSYIGWLGYLIVAIAIVSYGIIFWLAFGRFKRHMAARISVFLICTFLFALLTLCLITPHTFGERFLSIPLYPFSLIAIFIMLVFNKWWLIIGILLALVALWIGICTKLNTRLLIFAAPVAGISLVVIPLLFHGIAASNTMRIRAQELGLTCYSSRSIFQGVWNMDNYYQNLHGYGLSEDVRYLWSYRENDWVETTIVALEKRLPNQDCIPPHDPRPHSRCRCLAQWPLSHLAASCVARRAVVARRQGLASHCLWRFGQTWAQ